MAQKRSPQRQGGEVAPLPADAPELGLYQVLDEKGAFDEARVPPLSDAELGRIYRGMLLIRIMDERLLALQRQGRIGFYGEARGQEAAVVGAAAALGPDDWIVPALREAGAALYRGLPLSTYIAQIFGNDRDVSRGRQLPCHPGTRQARYVTMSSCIASQLPHAVGLAWAAKYRGDDAVVLGCLGDGATSEEDFHVAANFAGVMRVPLVFFCQNNQWAISTPVARQTAAPTMAIKAVAYGFPGVRCDGNDLFAVYHCVSEAVARARRGEGPTLVEALTYRVSAHSSSDDPSRYRDERITAEWNRRDPVARLRGWLRETGRLDEAGDRQLHETLEAEVRDAIAVEERAAPPPVESLFDDVFAELPAHLGEQRKELLQAPRQKLGGVHQ